MIPVRRVEGSVLAIAQIADRWSIKTCRSEREEGDGVGEEVAEPLDEGEEAGDEGALGWLGWVGLVRGAVGLFVWVWHGERVPDCGGGGQYGEWTERGTAKGRLCWVACR